MVVKGTTNYKLNRMVEERGRRLVEMGFHNTMSDLIEYATLTHIVRLERLVLGLQAHEQEGE